MWGAETTEPFMSPYPIINVTVDAVVLRQVHGFAGEPMWEVLVIRRKAEPFRGHWALPGGFVNPDENALDACKRELLEETGLDLGRGLWQSLPPMTEPDRDPRNRTISLPYLHTISRLDVPANLAEWERSCLIKAGDDAAEVAWRPFSGSGFMAFDHADILDRAAEVLSLVRPK